MRIPAVLALAFACLCPAFAADAAASKSAVSGAVILIPSSTHTVIGGLFELNAVITKEAHQKVENIILPASANIKFSLAEHQKGAQNDYARFELRFFDLGEVTVPSPEFVISSAVVRGEPFGVFVKGRLGEAEAEIKKLRPQKRGAFPKLIALIALLAALAAAYYFLRRKQVLVSPEEQMSPEEWYASALDALDRNTPVNELLDGLSDTFRIYLEKKRGLPAIFLDTSEIDAELKKRAFSTEERLKAVSFLRSCDLAKFAGQSFDEREIDKLFKDACSFAGIGGRGSS
ncbi:MAG: hypothetical protein ABII20_03290 [Candidatus Omnitrophota bacterium]|nr:hypothetical protein [Candidatus Omnitrophota bacterium]